MPGKPKSKSIKDWKMYEALKKEGMDKSKAAAITNASVNKRKQKAQRKKKAK